MRRTRSILYLSLAGGLRQRRRQRRQLGADDHRSRRHVGRGHGRRARCERRHDRRPGQHDRHADAWLELERSACGPADDSSGTGDDGPAPPSDPFECDALGDAVVFCSDFEEGDLSIWDDFDLRHPVTVA